MKGILNKQESTKESCNFSLVHLSCIEYLFANKLRYVKWWHERGLLSAAAQSLVIVYVLSAFCCFLLVSESSLALCSVCDGSGTLSGKMIKSWLWASGSCAV